MHISSILSTILLTATMATAQYTNQSAPFTLQLQSENKTLDGAYLSACHSGALIESLCLNASPSPPHVYNLNSSEFSAGAGYLVWVLRGTGFNFSTPMKLEYSPSSNVALPLFQSEQYGSSVGFNEQDLLYVQDYVDDTVSPPNASHGYDSLYRWYACTTYYLGYTYQTLAWGLGKYPPQNPSCVKVDVKRVFV